MNKHHQKHSVLAKQDVVVLNIPPNEREVKLEKSSVDKRVDRQKKRPGLADLLKSIRITETLHYQNHTTQRKYLSLFLLGVGQ